MHLGVGDTALFALPRSTVFDLIEINEASGCILTSRGVNLTLWSVNGLVLASKQTSISQYVTALGMPCGAEWLPALQLVVSGHRDGSIRAWRIVECDNSDASPYRFDLVAKMEKTNSSAVTAISFNNLNRRLWLGDASGNLFKYTELQRRHVTISCTLQLI